MRRVDGVRSLTENSSQPALWKLANGGCLTRASLGPVADTSR